MNDILLTLLAGLSIGFLGSVHCIGMCGPIALALPVNSKAGWSKYASIFLYNFGRALTYGVLGFIFGFLGSRFRLWGLQQAISISAGVMILWFIFSRFSISSRFKKISEFNEWIQRHLGQLLRAPGNPVSFLSIGLLNGLLPCGLVYVAMASALATTDMLKGTLLMFAFGIGTIPIMAGLMVFGHLISIRFRQYLNKAVPVFIGMMAIILILRGLNLGVPFLSPKMDKDATEASCCRTPDK